DLGSRRRLAAVAAGVDPGLAGYPATLSRFHAGAVLADDLHGRHGCRARVPVLRTLQTRRGGIPAVPGSVAGTLGVPGLDGLGSLHHVYRTRSGNPFDADAVHG